MKTKTLYGLAQAECCNWHTSVGGCVLSGPNHAEGECLMRTRAAPCSHFEKCVLPAHPGFVADYQRTFKDARVAVAAKDLRHCACGELLRGRRVRCTACATKRLRHQKREYWKSRTRKVAI